MDDSNAAAMASSQDESVAAALDYLGTPYTTTLSVHAVVEAGPRGQAPGGGRAGLRGRQPGDLPGAAALATGRGGLRGADVTVRRDGATTTEHVELTRGEDGTSWQLGVYLVPSYDFPVDVEFQLEQVAGPARA